MRARSGSGIATESSAALTRVGFEVCNADRIEIRIDPRNQASFGIPRKLGFVEEATLRRRLPSREGEPLRDVTIFTMFREDFDPAHRRRDPRLRRPRRTCPLKTCLGISYRDVSGSARLRTGSNSFDATTRLPVDLSR